MARELRRDILQAIFAAGSGHPGGSLSELEILISLYFHALRHNPAIPSWPERDRLILSKGHASPGLYAVLARAGYIAQEELATFRKLDSRLQGHAHPMTPGVEMNSGSLGMGLSFALGCALAARLDRKDYLVYALLGDGECDEGEVWEAAMAAAHHKANNLIAIVDRNRIQNDRFTDEVMSLEPLAQKWRSFGWRVLETDGHDFPSLLTTIDKSRDQAHPPYGDHRSHGQRQRCYFHGKQSRFPRTRSQPGGVRASHEGTSLMVAQKTMASTREAYGRTLLNLAEDYPDIVVLGGDLNVSVFTHLWRDKYPDRFFDFGPAEQNIIGVGAGLAASGKIPFVSTFAVFGVGRPFDQLRVLVSQPRLNLKLVCTHSGILTGEDGMSAHGIEDLALTCSLDGFHVVVPSDAEEASQAVRVAAQTEGPFYIRLSRATTPVVHDPSYRFNLGRSEIIRQGSDLTIIATGTMVSVSLDSADLLAQSGIQARVVNMHTLKPADEATILAAARETGAIVTAEEHYIHGGLGSIVAQVVGQGHPVPMEIVALRGYSVSGKAEELMARNGLSPTSIQSAAQTVLQRKQR